MELQNLSHVTKQYVLVTGSQPHQLSLVIDFVSPSKNQLVVM